MFKQSEEITRSPNPTYNSARNRRDFETHLTIVHEVQESADILGLHVPEHDDGVGGLGLLQDTLEGVAAGRQDDLNSVTVNL